MRYYQCRLQQDHAHTVGWIEERGAKAGALVEIEAVLAVDLYRADELADIEAGADGNNVELMEGAVLHAHAASPVVVRLSAGQAGAASKAVLSIAYHGRSASAAVRTRIYQRFADGAVRDDKELGWLLVSRIAQLHRASIRFTGATGGACGLQLTFATVDLLHDEAGL